MASTKAKAAISVGVGGVLVAAIVVIVVLLRDPQARGERLVEKQIVKPLALATNYNSPVYSTMPKGFHVLNNVPLQIDGMICLWGEGGASRGMVNPKEVLNIPVMELFQTLYVYHKASFGSPPGTPVCDVVLRYLDGTAVTNRLLYGDDVLDWYAPPGDRVKGPTSPNSKLAWVGQHPVQGGGIQQLRTCMTAIENPTPRITVEAIDLISCQNRTVICIMGMTMGKPGLMDEAAAPTDDRQK